MYVMVVARSVEYSGKLREWFNNWEKALEEAEFWISAGTLEHWGWSLAYAFNYSDERGPDGALHVYWGSRISLSESDNLYSIFKGRGLRTMSANLLNHYMLSKPNIVFFYLNGEGVIGAGLVVSVEEDFFELFWPFEKKSGKVEFPFRFKMRVLWLHESVLRNPFSPEKWRGDKSFLDYKPRSGLQRIAKDEDKKRVRAYLLDRLKDSLLTVSKVFSSLAGQDVDWKVEELWRGMEETGLYVSRSVVEELVSALAAGRHVILAGPPGTGKTTLARLTARYHGLEAVVYTATSDWTRIDVVGGPVYVGREVVWRSGCLLEAIARWYMGRGALLVLDEINRANVDRVFGEFFTIFGDSNPHGWRLPVSLMEEIEGFKVSGGKVDRYAATLLEAWHGIGKEEGLPVPPGFRVIATMNTFDRRYLFTLGYALLRRFAIIEVTNPGENELKEILEKHGKEELVEEALKLYRALSQAGVELGVALLIDLVKQADLLTRYGASPREAVARAFKNTVIYQLEGLPLDKLKRARDELGKLGYNGLAQDMERLYPELTS